MNKILKQYRESNADTTPAKDSPERFLWMGIKTPETPLGACMVENPSPQLRKECELWLRQFPDFEPPLQRRLSTVRIKFILLERIRMIFVFQPLSEIKKQLWNKILKKGENSQSDQGKLNAEYEEHRTDADEMNVEEPKEVSTDFLNLLLDP